MKTHPIKAFVIYEFLAMCGLCMSATTGALLQLQVGMSLSDIALVNIAFWAVIIAMELPTGMLADGRSRIWSVRVGIVLFALGALAYTFVQGVKTALIGEILVGIGFAFCSGAEDAWLTDALKKRGETHLLGQTFGIKSMANSAGALVGGLIGSVLGLMSYRLSWLAAALLLSGAAWAAFRLMDDAGEVDERCSEWEALRLSCVAIRKVKGLAWAIGATVVFGLVVSLNHYWAPLFKEGMGQLGLGLIWVTIHGALFTAGWLVKRWGVPEGRAALGMVVAILLAGAGLVLVGASAFLPAMVLSLMVHEFGRGLFRPILNTFIQRRVESRYRATFGSLQSLLGKTGLALSLLLIWAISYGKEASGETILFIWTVCGSLLMIGAVLLWVLRPHSD